ncbi:MAG: serine/threonine protein kinase, partial [Planctomycetaceae bacterium]|nr:serine/threonine protein kinase [Planctomycetaceae bacterium]
MVSPGRGRDLDQMRQIDSIADEFELAFHSGERPRIEEYLARVPVSLRQLLLHELLRIDLEWLQRWGQTVLPQDYLQRFPQHRELVQSALESAGAWPAELIDSTEPAGETQPAAVGSSVIRCPGRFGRFELQRPLGTGGFGTVFLAQDTQLGRQVALKIPKVSEGNRRFLAEARAAAKLEHPNIVAVHDSGTIEGNLFIVCRFVDGEDLSSFVKHHPHSLRQLVTWIRDAARALAHAHSQGVIHRDIKPGNLLISRDGQVYVADFGLARRVEDSSSLTADGTVLGTPAYMAPEQAAGRTTDIGTHSDQYSLGVVLYELLTGRRPFLGNVREVLQKVIHTPAPPPRMLHPKVPVELEAICLRAMAKDPNARYPSMGAFADDLDRWLQLRAQQTVASGGEGFQLGKLLKSGWFQAACAVAVLGALGMGGLVLSLLSSGGDASRTDTVRPSPKATLPAANPSVASVDDAPAEDPR